MTPLWQADLCSLIAVTDDVSSYGEVRIRLCSGAPPIRVVGQSAVERRCDLEAIAGVRGGPVVADQALQLSPYRPPWLAIEAKSGGEPTWVGVWEVETDQDALALVHSVNEELTDHRLRDAAR